MTETAPSNRSSPESTTDEQIGRLLNEYVERYGHGEVISEDLLKAEHPALASVLAQHLSMVQALTTGADPIQDLLSKRMLLPPSLPDSVAELGHYKIKGVIGRGGMGIVLRAIETPLNRPVALKILRPELAVDHRALVRFEHEAKAAAALRHPNIVTVYACGSLNGTHYLAMEAVDGLSLADRLPREPALSTEEIRRIFRELLLGLNAAHRAGLVHRDIKPSNLLLDGPKETVKMADFGLARIASSSTRITIPQVALGTPEYMSPEQARGDEDIDHRTDLYSAGVVLFEMLTGRVPFKGDTASAVIHAILNIDPPKPGTIRRGADERLSQMALQLMAKRRENRFASAEKAIVALEQHQGSQLRWSDRSRAIMLSAALLITAVVCALWARSTFNPDRTVVRSITTETVDHHVETSQSGSSEPILSGVQLWRPNNVDTPTISARWGDDLDYKEFYTFPDPLQLVLTVTEVKLGQKDDPFVLAGIQSSGNDEALFAFDSKRCDARSRLSLWSERIAIQPTWPDCSPSTGAAVPVIVAFDCDGASGQEVVFAAKDRIEYPSYIAVFDPRTRSYVAKYWHVGQISHLEVVADLLGAGRPGIIAMGMNNKLDGFDQPRTEDPEPVASFDIVQIVTVLDIASMSGEHVINIPDVRRRMPHLDPVIPYAYVFLDTARTPGGQPHIDRATGKRRPPSKAHHDREIMTLAVPKIVPCPGNVGYPSCIEIGIKRDELENEPGGVNVTFDPELNCVKFVANSSEVEGRDQEYWLEKFHHLVVRGQYVSASEGPPFDCSRSSD